MPFAVRRTVLPEIVRTSAGTETRTAICASRGTSKAPDSGASCAGATSIAPFKRTDSMAVLACPVPPLRRSAPWGWGVAVWRRRGAVVRSVREPERLWRGVEGREAGQGRGRRDPAHDRDRAIREQGRGVSPPEVVRTRDQGGASLARIDELRGRNLAAAVAASDHEDPAVSQE